MAAKSLSEDANSMICLVKEQVILPNQLGEQYQEMM